MKQYRVIVTPSAKEDLRNRLSYLLNDLQNLQAYDNVLNDYEATIDALETSAGILRPCDNPALADRGLHRINFGSHDYFMLYYIADDVIGVGEAGSTAYVTNIFHGREDYANKLT